MSRFTKPLSRNLYPGYNGTTQKREYFWRGKQLPPATGRIVWEHGKTWLPSEYVACGMSGLKVRGLDFEPYSL